MKRLLVLLLIHCIDLPVSTDVSYRNGGPRNELMPYSDRAVPQMLADSFTLQASSTTATQVHWWGDYGRLALTNVDQFIISIYRDPDGMSVQGSGALVILGMGLTELAECRGSYAIKEFGHNDGR